MTAYHKTITGVIVAAAAVAAFAVWLHLHDRNVLARARQEREADSVRVATEAFYRGVRLYDSTATMAIHRARREADSAKQVADASQRRWTETVRALDDTTKSPYWHVSRVRAIVDTANRIITDLNLALRKNQLALRFAIIRGDSLRVMLDTAAAIAWRTQHMLDAVIASQRVPFFSLRRVQPSINAGLGTKGFDVQVGVSYQLGRP